MRRKRSAVPLKLQLCCHSMPFNAARTFCFSQKTPRSNLGRYLPHGFPPIPALFAETIPPTLANRHLIFVFIYLTWIMIAQPLLDCKPILIEKFRKYIDNPVLWCYDKENFERKELSKMLNINKNLNLGRRSLAPWCAQLA